MKRGYFCESCGAAVKPGDESCPNCGRSFSGVRCPRCGREGPAGEFTRGCPDCGYTAETPGPEEAEPGPLIPHSRRPHRRTNRRREPPPAFYWILSALLLVALALLITLWSAS